MSIDQSSCACGCETPVAPPKRYVRGHNMSKVPPESLYSVTPSGCWVWEGAKTACGSYGRFGPTGRFAHRVFYEQANGPVDEGLHLHHTCEVPLCVNPAHLEPLTPAEHAGRHRATRAPQSKSHCLRGHRMTDENVYVAPKTGARNCRACGALRARIYYRMEAAA